uniref:Cnidarian restricted protein n=1 Tax=Clytia hemisphaerica TaxID=252671 RepID=A0A7M5UYM7_9CNID
MTFKEFHPIMIALILISLSLSTTTRASLTNTNNLQTTPSTHNLKVELLTNPRTNHTTADCTFRNKNTVLYFKVTQSGGARHRALYLHAKNVKTKETLHPVKCYLMETNDRKYKCFAWRWHNLYNNLFNQTTERPKKYKLWLTKKEIPYSDIIWQIKMFKLAKHIFGCSNHTIYNLTVSNMEEVSIDLAWKLKPVPQVFKPRFMIKVDGILKWNDTIKCNGVSCRKKLLGISKCSKHRICVQIEYERRFLPGHIVLDEVCIVKPPKCYHRGKPGRSRIRKLVPYIVPVGAFIFLIALIIFVKHKCYEKRVDHDEDNILPRGHSIVDKQQLDIIEPSVGYSYPDVVNNRPLNIHIHQNEFPRGSGQILADNNLVPPVTYYSGIYPTLANNIRDQESDQNSICKPIQQTLGDAHQLNEKHMTSLYPSLVGLQNNSNGLPADLEKGDNSYSPLQMNQNNELSDEKYMADKRIQIVDLQTFQTKTSDKLNENNDIRARDKLARQPISQSSSMVESITDEKESKLQSFLRRIGIMRRRSSTTDSKKLLP